MANITLLGASYTDVPAVDLPQTGGGTVRFYESGGGTGAVSVVDTSDSHGGTVRTITALDISDSTLTTADQLAQGITGYNKFGVKLTGTGGGGPSATQHTIYFEFTDETDTTITAYYDSTFISDAITATTPTTYGGKTVDSASLDGVAWYTRPTETWETLYEDNSLQYNADQSANYPYCWISSLSDVYPTVGSVWRITFNGTEYRCTAKNASMEGSTVIVIGNPKWSDEADDGSDVPCNFSNQGWGAWSGGADLPNVSQTVPVKIERLVTS